MTQPRKIPLTSIELIGKFSVIVLRKAWTNHWAARNTDRKFEYGKLHLPDAIHGEKQGCGLLLTQFKICKALNWMLFGRLARFGMASALLITVEENGSRNIHRTMEIL